MTNALKPSQESAAADGNVFVARQPVFDQDLQVTGYELLFRDSLRNAFAHHDGNQATRRTVDTSLNVMGLSRLVADRLAFVNLTGELLLERFYEVLPARQTVVELLEDTEVDDEVVAACRRLREAGYRLALDDFVFDPSYRPLLEIADIVKIDVLATPAAEAHQLMRRHARPGLTFLAEKVETYEALEQARSTGYRLFQGYFFCKPEVLQARELPSNKQHCLMLLTQVACDQPNFDTVEQTIKSEPGLSVKLLSYLNSASVGLSEQVRSIRHAITLLGAEPLRRWAALVATTAMGEDKPQELARTCLARARFCELVGEGVATLDQPSVDRFLLGLLSALDALLDRPLPDLLADMPVSGAIKEALMGGSTPMAKLQFLALACERGDWTKARVLAKLLGVSEWRLAERYVAAMEWADEVLDDDGN